jgi:hypothetical protein
MTDTPESAIVAMLKGSAIVAAVIDDRVWPNARPQGTAFPAITVTRVSGGPEYADDGEVGLLPARIQVSCWGISYSSAKELSQLVTASLTPGHDVTQGAITFIYILLDNEQDLHEFGANNAEYPHQVALDFLTMTTR